VVVFAFKFFKFELWVRIVALLLGLMGVVVVLLLVNVVFLLLHGVVEIIFVDLGTMDVVVGVAVAEGFVVVAHEFMFLMPLFGETLVVVIVMYLVFIWSDIVLFKTKVEFGALSLIVGVVRVTVFGFNKDVLAIDIDGFKLEHLVICAEFALLPLIGVVVRILT
jgi:hypothetical protein